jgi:chromosome segregation ATPase
MRRKGEKRHQTTAALAVAVLAMFLLLCSGCAKTYYNAMEKVGIHKRDIMVDRVEAARDSQTEAQEQFKSALEQFASVVKLKETDLKKAYDRLNDEYEQCQDAADDVSDRIEKVESVADALFDEWEQELTEYQNRDLRRASQEKLITTKKRYGEMLTSMHRAEASMQPVLHIFKDNVLFLKHNLNAQAIGSLQSEFTSLKGQIDVLIKKMDIAIRSSNTFIDHINK